MFQLGPSAPSQKLNILVKILQGRDAITEVNVANDGQQHQTTQL